MNVPTGIDGVSELVEVGRGGFGVVYRGVEDQFGRHVAVKVLSAHFDEQARRRFDRERRAMGSVTGHPNVVTVFRDGTTDAGEPYLVMEFVPGGSLADRLDRHGPMQWREAAETGAKLAEALAVAHDNGILHRDVKPANVLLSQSGQPKLGDFGIARLDDGFETKSGSITASIAHVPPELLDGTRADERSDLYSLASTIHTLVAGRPPFSRDDDIAIAALLSRIAGQPPPPLNLGPDAREFESVVRRGLAKRPDDRFADAREFAAALRASLSAPTEPIEPSSSPVADAPTQDYHLAGTVAAAPSVASVSSTATGAPAAAGVGTTIARPSRAPLFVALGVLVAAIVGGLLIGQAVIGDADPVTMAIPTPTAQVAFASPTPEPEPEPTPTAEAGTQGTTSEATETPEPTPTATAAPTPTATPPPPTPTPNTFPGLRGGGGTGTDGGAVTVDDFASLSDTSGTIMLGAPIVWADDVFSSSNSSLFPELPGQQRVAALAVGGDFGALGGPVGERDFNDSGVVVIARRVTTPIDQLDLLDFAVTAVADCDLSQRSELLIPALGTADVELLACDEPGNPSNVVGFIVIAIVPDDDPTLPTTVLVQLADNDEDQSDTVVAITSSLQIDGSQLPPP